MTATATLIKRHSVGGVVTSVFSLAFTGSYSTGGDAIDFASVMGYTTHKPDYVTIDGIAGYSYSWDKVNNKILVFQSGTQSGTFAGTAVQPTFFVGSGTFLANGGIGLSADSSSATVKGGSAITTDRTLTTTSPVGTITPSGLITGGAAAPESQIPASSYPAGVTGDTVTALAVWVNTPALA